MKIIIQKDPFEEINAPDYHAYAISVERRRKTAYIGRVWTVNKAGWGAMSAGGHLHNVGTPFRRRREAIDALIKTRRELGMEVGK